MKVCTCTVLQWYIFHAHNHFQTAKQKAGGPGDKETLLRGTAAFMITLPGKILDISALNSQHKFRDRRKKQGAVDAIGHLEEAGLGVIHKERATRGTALVSIIYYTCTC